MQLLKETKQPIEATKEHPKRVDYEYEIVAWSDHTNAKQRGVDWQLQIDEARTKLARLYPKIKPG